jgi:glycerophosphoryl diester phosphodiesterase
VWQRVGSGWPSFEPIPTLEQVMTEGADPTAGWRLVVEIKDIPGEPGFDVDCVELAGALVRTARRTGFPAGRLIVQSFWPFCLDEVARLAPAIQTLFLTSSSAISDVTGLPLPLGFTMTENALFATLRGYDISAPDHTAPDLNALTVSAAHLLGRRVVVWTPNTTPRMRALARMGVDGLISDYPDRLIQALGP